MKNPAAKQPQRRAAVPIDVIKKPTPRKPAEKIALVAKHVGAAATAALSKNRFNTGPADAVRKPARSTRHTSAPQAVVNYPPRLNLLDFRALYQSTPANRIELIRAGVSAADIKALASILGIPQERFFRMFGIAQATVTRKASKEQVMSREVSEKIIGMAKMVGLVETMLEQSGDPDLMQNFDTPKWLARWIGESIPALGGKSPADYMDTMEGQEMVSRLLAVMQSGAYA